MERAARSEVTTAGPRVALLVLLGSTLTGCLVDKGKCGPHQESNVAGNCVCVSGYVPDESLVCRPCGENSVSLANQCSCALGFTRDAEQRCVPQAVGVGQPCTGEGTCLPSAPYCHGHASGVSYCTVSGCASSEDCPGGYGCDVRQVPAVCVRPPTGLGDPCTSQQECAGKEASYCETASSQVCLVADCKEDADCFADWTCCDLTSFGLRALCVVGGTCPVP